MKSLRHGALFAAVLALATTALAAPLSDADILGRIASAPDMPNEDAVIIFDGYYLDLRDGLATLRRQQLVRLGSEFAIEHHGDPRVGWDAGRQELEIIANRSYLPDGRMIPAPDNAHNEVTPFGLDLAVDFLDRREMVITRTGLELGAVVFLDTRIRDTKPGPICHDLIFPHGDEPCLEMEIVVSGEAKAAAVNPAGGLCALPEGIEDGSSTRWRLLDLPPLPLDSGRRRGDQQPWIAVSALSDWEDFGQMLADHVERAAGNSEGLSALLASLNDEKRPPDAEARLSRWLELAEDHTAIVRVGDAPVRDLARVLETSTATPLERCALIMACCRESGLDAELVLPSAWNSRQLGLPGLSGCADPGVLVDDQILAWPARGKHTRLWPALPTLRTGNGSPGWQGASTADRVNLLRMDVDWDLTDGSAKVFFTLAGPEVAALDFRHPETLAESWASGWSDSARAASVDVLHSAGDSLALRLSIDAPGPDADERGETVIALPLPPADLLGLFPADVSLGRSALSGLIFPSAALDLQIHWRLRLPTDASLLEREDIALSAPGAGFFLHRERQGDTLLIDCELGWDRRAIGEASWPAWRQMLLAALDDESRTVVLPAADQGGVDR